MIDQLLFKMLGYYGNKYKLVLELVYVDFQSIHLKWNKPQNVLNPLFQLDLNEKGELWKVVYRGFHNYFCLKNLSGGHTYKFKLFMEANDKRMPDTLAVDMATLSCTTKNECPSVTAFHHSTSENLPLLFREFLDTRAKDINVFNELGECGLSKACEAGNGDMVLTLLQFGADVNLPNMFTKMTPLMTAAYHGHSDVIRILAHNDADATLRDILFNTLNILLTFRNLKTALHYAVDGSHNDAVKMLLNGNWSDVNSVDSKGWTPLMRAVIMFTNLDVITTLVDHGVNLNIKDKNGQDVWQLAHLSNNWNALEILPD